MNKIIYLSISILLIAGCKDEIKQSVDSSKYYVDSQEGNDVYPGTSPEKAWKSLQRLSQQKLKAGDQFYLSGSSHFHGSLNFHNLEGTKESPLVITSYGEGRAVIESGNSYAVLAQNCKYLKIINIQVSGSGRLNGNTTNGIEPVNCRFSEIDSVKANGYLYSGIRVTGGGLLVAYSNVTQRSAVLNVQVDVENEYDKTKNATLQYTLVDPDGKTVFSKSDADQTIPAQGFSRFKQQFTIVESRLWSTSRPELYKLKGFLILDGQPVDSISEAIIIT
jgi:hypothetical protein